MAKKVKTNVAELRREQKKTGGGPTPAKLSQNDQKMADLLGDELMPLDNEFDSDNKFQTHVLSSDHYDMNNSDVKTPNEQEIELIKETSVDDNACKKLETPVRKRIKTEIKLEKSPILSTVDMRLAEHQSFMEKLDLEKKVQKSKLRILKLKEEYWVKRNNQINDSIHVITPAINESNNITVNLEQFNC